MKTRPTLRCRSFWVLLILSVTALCIGQWGYSRWQDARLRRQLIGRWGGPVDEDSDEIILFDADGTFTSPENDRGDWWISSGMLYMRFRSPDGVEGLPYGRPTFTDEDSLTIQLGFDEPSHWDLILFEIPLGERFESLGEEYKEEWKRVRP